jgi:hypothetical protein
VFNGIGIQNVICRYWQLLSVSGHCCGYDVKQQKLGNCWMDNQVCGLLFMFNVHSNKNQNGKNIHKITTYTKYSGFRALLEIFDINLRLVVGKESDVRTRYKSLVSAQSFKI